MKNLTILKKTIAVFCALVMVIALVPSAAFAMDLSAYQQAIAEYQAAASAQMQAAQQAAQQAQQEMMEAYMENVLFDVDAAYRRLVSCKNGDQRAAYFFSLTEYQRFRLVEYLGQMIQLGYFRGFDDFDIPGLEEDGTVTMTYDGEIDKTEEEQFEELYATYIDLYEKYGSAADYSGISQSAYQRIKALVEGRKAAAEAPEETDEETAPAADGEATPTADGEAAPAADAPAVEEPVEEEPVLTEEELFCRDYEQYINLYKAVGSAGDYSSIPYEAYLRIQAMFEESEADDEIEGTDEPEDIDKPEDNDDVEDIDESKDNDDVEETDDVEDIDETKDPGESKDVDNAEDIGESEEIDEPDATDGSGEQDEPEITDKPEVELKVESVALPEPKSVMITSSLDNTITPLGAPVTLTGVLEDANDFDEVIYVWEVDKGNGYEAVPDADGMTYTYPATVESLRWSWRLSVYYR